MGWRDEDDDNFDDLRRDRDRSPPAPQGSAALGISSIVVAFVSIIAVIGIFVIIVVMAAANNRPPGPRDAAMIFLSFGLFIASLLLAVVGLVLGAVGVFSANATGMTCGIIGAVLNAMIVFGILGLMCFGVLTGR